MNTLFDTHPQVWANTLPPTRSAAIARIARVRPAAYARSRNHLDGAVTGLSPYLTHGLVTLREVLAGVLEREPLSVQHKLVSRSCSRCTPARVPTPPMRAPCPTTSAKRALAYPWSTRP
jgi:hypothetical protein